ncbi:unnamed protein product, partial [Prorocentrum cordatum]
MRAGGFPTCYFLGKELSAFISLRPRGHFFRGDSAATSGANCGSALALAQQQSNIAEQIESEKQCPKELDARLVEAEANIRKVGMRPRFLAALTGCVGGPHLAAEWVGLAALLPARSSTSAPLALGGPRGPAFCGLRGVEESKAAWHVKSAVEHLAMFSGADCEEALQLMGASLGFQVQRVSPRQGPDEGIARVFTFAQSTQFEAPGKGERIIAPGAGRIAKPEPAAKPMVDRLGDDEVKDLRGFLKRRGRWAALGWGQRRYRRLQLFGDDYLARLPGVFESWEGQPSRRESWFFGTFDCICKPAGWAHQAIKAIASEKGPSSGAVLGDLRKYCENSSHAELMVCSDAPKVNGVALAGRSYATGLTKLLLRSSFKKVAAKYFSVSFGIVVDDFALQCAGQQEAMASELPGRPRDFLQRMKNKRAPVHAGNFCYPTCDSDGRVLVGRSLGRDIDDGRWRAASIVAARAREGKAEPRCWDCALCDAATGADGHRRCRRDAHAVFRRAEGMAEILQHSDAAHAAGARRGELFTRCLFGAVSYIPPWQGPIGEQVFSCSAPYNAPDRRAGLLRPPRTAGSVSADGSSVGIRWPDLLRAGWSHLLCDRFGQAVASARGWAPLPMAPRLEARDGEDCARHVAPLICGDQVDFPTNCQRAVDGATRVKDGVYPWSLKSHALAQRHVTAGAGKLAPKPNAALVCQKCCSYGHSRLAWPSLLGRHGDSGSAAIKPRKDAFTMGGGGGGSRCQPAGYGANEAVHLIDGRAQQVRDVVDGLDDPRGGRRGVASLPEPRATLAAQSTVGAPAVE